LTSPRLSHGALYAGAATDLLVVRAFTLNLCVDLRLIGLPFIAAIRMAFDLQLKV
jgi:hypothetical protein